MRIENVVVPVTRQLEQWLRRPVRGNGGFQAVLDGLQRCRRNRLGFDELWIDPKSVLAMRIVAYVDRHGSGGFQQRLRPIAEALRPHVVLPETGSLFEAEGERRL